MTKKAKRGKMLLKEEIYLLISQKKYSLLKKITKKYNIKKNIFNGNNILHSSIKDNRDDITNLLLKNPELNFQFENIAKNNRGKGYIHLAAKQGKKNLVKKLIFEKNVFVDEFCGEGKTGLYYAFKKRAFDVVIFFLENGADVDFIWMVIFEDLVFSKKNHDFENFEDFENFDILENLKIILNFYNIEFVDFDINSSIRLIFSEKKIKLIFSENIKKNILYYSLFFKNLEIFKKIVNSGAKIFKRDENGFDIFFSACLISEKKIIKFLLNFNFDINQKIQNISPIDIILKLKNYEIFEIFLKKKKSIFFKKIQMG